MNASQTVKVWDPLVRVAHWSLVLAFTLAYLTGDDDRSPWHEWSGYTVLGLVALRILWGFVGPGHARFSDFVRGPRTVFAYARDFARGRAQRYLGHNPLGATMIVALLASLTIACVSGWMLLDRASPAAALTSIAAAGAEGGVNKREHEHGALEETHEFFANLSVLLVLLHIGGVAVASLAHRENLVRAMFTGRKRR